MTSVAHPIIDVLFVLLPGSVLLDWAGPAEAFRLANQALARVGKPPSFAVRAVGPETETRSSVGVMLGHIEPLPKTLRHPSWIILVGNTDESFAPQSASYTAVLRWLRHVGEQLTAGNRLVTICAGALIAADAGLLAGRRVTTHHQEFEKLKALEPTCDVVQNRVFVIDESAQGSVYSSAGITTGIDLALHMVGQICGAPLAARVAETMVVAMRRGLDDPAISPFLRYRHHMHPALHRLQDAINQDPQADWTLPAMATVSCTSSRHLTRLFALHAGISPLHYLRSIRLAVADTALMSGSNVTQAAELAGFKSDTQLRRSRRSVGKLGEPLLGE